MQLCSALAPLLLSFYASSRTAVPAPRADPIYLRIGLVRAIGHPGAVEIAAREGARLCDAGGTAIAVGPAAWRLTAGPRGVVALDAAGQEIAAASVLQVAPSMSADDTIAVSAVGGRPHRYRGTIEVNTDREGRLTVINRVEIEQYLRGVLPLEMPPSAPAEALKAQAVVARGYAARMRGRYASRGYDLTDTTDSQMYGGASAEKDAADSAIRATASTVLYLHGDLVLADYYDDCGGVTSPGDRQGDYPPSASDAPEDGGPDYCSAGLYHRWTLRLSADEILKRLPTDKRRGIGAITHAQITERDTSGRAVTVSVGSDSGVCAIAGSAFRALIGYDRLKSTLFTVSRDPDGAFVFTGKGYGHGHGMCQMGAMGLASPPYRRSFGEILAHYFPGSTMGPLGREHRPERTPRD